MQVGLASLALVIAVSPASVVPAILMLHTPRPLAAGWAFAVGWMLSVAATTWIFVEVAGQLPDADGPPPPWIRPATMMLAVILILAGLVTWMRRGRSERAPVWLRTLDLVTAPRALAAAPVLAAVNPKVLSACAAAGFSIGATTQTRLAQWGDVTGFALLASATVIVPVLSYAIWREHMSEPLRRLRVALERHNATILAVVLVAVGLMLLLQAA
ncbi:GAP family protein [Mycolicibacterium fluoranthenivorans]|uniref:GAP family protein n=1 Tax=Mycolicibacterium fluoranthenivorans TaxID=258505 RepID=A0A7G8P8V7_9MYCO|nr:GAP family protein [Mycolicibacterium fluoranthenivorans]QNJ90773.1 GAP family protein [Mycolicibacterium fluoranthenivorans]